MGLAFVLGNGTSRRSVDPQQLKNYGPVYGCNALYREFVPTVLIATDRPISERIQYEGYPVNNRFYTRRPMEGFGAHAVPTKYFGYSSGPIAVSLAAFDGHTVVYLLGFDMGPTANNKFNNIYADTEFYRSSSSEPTYTGNWINQIVTICKDFVKTHQFIRVKGDVTASIPELEKIPNLHHMSMSEFMERLTVTKNL